MSACMHVFLTILDGLLAPSELKHVYTLNEKKQQNVATGIRFKVCAVVSSKWIPLRLFRGFFSGPTNAQ